MKFSTYLLLLFIPIIAYLIIILYFNFQSINFFLFLPLLIYVMVLRLLRYRHLGFNWKQSFSLYLAGPLHKQYKKVWKEEMILLFSLIGIAVMALIIFNQ